jgi:L-iditol 2-dehydrogenase
VSPQGGFAEYTVVPEVSVFPLSDQVSLATGVFAEPLSCALHAVSLAGVRPGDRVAIVGAGAIGLMLLQLVRTAGASRVLVTDPVAERRAMAERLGADLTVDPSSGDVQVAARDLTAGIGVDVAIEAVGTPPAVLDCIALPRKGGTAVLMGVAAPDLEVPLRPYDLYQRELTIRGSFIRAHNFARAVRLLADLDLETLITDSFPLAAAAQAIQNVADGRGVKTVVLPR